VDATGVCKDRAKLGKNQARKSRATPNQCRLAENKKTRNKEKKPEKLGDWDEKGDGER
jgi:hypothetical protein